MRIGLANGVFDLCHDGHRHLIRECLKRCDRLIVAINDDASVRRLKSEGRPIWGLDRRAISVLSLLRETDIVASFSDELDLIELIREYKPDVLFKGDQYAGARITGDDFAAVELIPMLPEISTSKLVADGAYPRN